jgi:hypothetical protein
MAKKTQTAETPAIEFDMPGATKLMAQFKGANLKTAPKMVEALAKTPSSEGIMRTLGVIAYYTGVDAKRTKIVGYKFDDVFKTFAAGHWQSGEIGEASLRGYKSRCSAFCEAGQMPYDATAIVTKALAVKNASFSWRAGMIRTLLTAHPKVKPSVSVIDAAFEVTEESGGSKKPVAAKLKAFVSAGIALAKTPGVLDYLAKDKATKAHMAEVFDRLHSLQTVIAADGKLSTGKKRAANAGIGVLVSAVAQLGGRRASA